MPTRREKVEAILAEIEQDKRNGRFDQIMSWDATLLIPMFYQAHYTEAVYKANIRAAGNAAVASWLFGLLLSEIK